MTAQLSSRCEKYVGRLGQLAAGELRGLERTRLEAHLRACGSCRAAADALGAGLLAARSWQPQVSAEHLAALNQRLEPFVPARAGATRGRRGAWFAAGALAAALGVILIGLWPGSSPTQLSAPQGRTLAQPVPLPPAVERRQVSPHLRMVTSAGWEGRVEGEPGDHSITLASGFVVLDFVGGEGRHLRVSAPDALVEVVGTRFYVEVTPGVTRVGVAEGKVRVLTLLGTQVLTAGDHLTLGGGDSPPPSRARPFLTDTYLMEHRASAPPEAVKRKPARRRQLQVNRDGPRAVEVSAASQLLERLAAAEELARLGQLREAIGAYRKLAKDAPPGAVRDMARYEMARLWGFRMGEIQRARSILAALARGSGEVSRQARLALCELDLKARPCQAAACLAELEANAHDFPLREEAARLYAHWGLEKVRCDGR